MLSAAAMGQQSLVRAITTQTVNKAARLAQIPYVRGLMEPEENH